MNQDVKPTVRELGARATRLALDLMREHTWACVILFAIATGSSVTLETMMQNLSRAEEDSRWIYQLGLGFVDLFEGVALILTLAHGVPKVRALAGPHLLRDPFATGYLNSFFAEYLRALAQTLLYSVLFIVPGLIRYGRLIFVPYVTLFNAEYRADKVDAVKLSVALSRGRLWRILAVSALTIAIQGGLEVLPQAEAFHSLALRLACGGLSFVIGIWTFSYMYELFVDAISRHPWEAGDGSDV